MPQPTARQIARYRFDTFMARGGSAIFLCLIGVFLSLLSVHVFLRFLVLFVVPSPSSPHQGSVLQNLYVVFLEMTAAGNMNQDLASSLPFKVTAILAGLSGVIMVSMLVGLVTTTLHQKLQTLKKGHSKVIESDHSLLLGWNDRVVEIIRELVIANESEADACVVILADKDKEDMDDYLSRHLPKTQSTRIVTRSGSPSSLINLDVASVTTSRSVIVLANCSDAAPRDAKARSDAQVIKTVLGVVSARTDEEDADELNVVAELFSARSRQVAEKISDEVTSIDAQDILAKILVQTSRSIGLSVVYNEILSFDGCEMYFHHADWRDMTFGQLQYYFPDGVPMGIRTGPGEIILNPPSDRLMGSSDELLILAEDDSTIQLLSSPVAMPRPLPLHDARAEQLVERELLIGWNEMVPNVLREYADYLPEGSSVDILLRSPPDHVRRRIDELSAAMPNLAIQLVQADPLDGDALHAIHPSDYDNVILLSHSDARAASQDDTTDSETIVILLLLRQLFEEVPLEAGARKTKLISEVLDSRNQELVTRAGVNDFVISNRLVSMLLAQISEEPDIRRVYDDLFSEAGSEIYLKPASLYLAELPQTLSYADMMGLARKRDEVCLGVKQQAHENDAKRNFGVKLIPEKNATFELGPEDCLIVLAEDDT